MVQDTILGIFVKGPWSSTESGSDFYTEWEDPKMPKSTFYAEMALKNGQMLFLCLTG